MSISSQSVIAVAHVVTWHASSRAGGVRLGAPALTSRGFKEADFEAVADILHQAVQIALKVSCPNEKQPMSTSWEVACGIFRRFQHSARNWVICDFGVLFLSKKKYIKTRCPETSPLCCEFVSVEHFGLFGATLHISICNECSQIQEKAGKRLPDFEKALSHDDPEIVALRQQSEALATKCVDAIDL
jgi:hypothetical protein